MRIPLPRSAGRALLGAALALGVCNADRVTPAGVDDIATYADGLGPTTPTGGSPPSAPS
jgi:hypothetical protein